MLNQDYPINYGQCKQGLLKTVHFSCWEAKSTVNGRRSTPVDAKSGHNWAVMTLDTATAGRRLILVFSWWIQGFAKDSGLKAEDACLLNIHTQNFHFSISFYDVWSYLTARTFIYVTVMGNMKEPFLWMSSTLGVAEGSVSHTHPLPEPVLCLHCNHNAQKERTYILAKPDPRTHVCWRLHIYSLPHEPPIHLFFLFFFFFICWKSTLETRTK